MTLIHDPSKLVKTTTCYHCGEPCAGGAIYADDHPFCCTGCKSVYEILNGCSLDAYYEMEKNPGIRPEELVGDFEFLELEEVRQRLIRFENDSVYKLQLFLPSIHCSSCIYLLEHLHKLDPEILSSRVNFHRRELSVTVTRSPDALRRVFALLSRLGYAPSLSENKREAELKDSRSLLVKIGITGFCFGNIMLLSIPEYISGRSVIEPAFERLFNILIIALIVPAMYFGARDYAVAAWKNLRHRYLSVDVPIVLGIAALFVRSLYEIILLGEPGYFDSLAGFLFFLLIGKWFQSRTYEHLAFDRDFRSFLPLAVLVKGSEGFRPVRVQDLQRGDLIKLRNREVLPVNAQLLDGMAEFDYSFVTGESDPVVKRKNDTLYAGGRLNSPNALLMVSETVSEGYLQGLWKEQDAKFRSSRLMNLIDQVSQRFTIAILLIAFSALGWWWFRTEWHRALEIFTAILIVACPCALALAAPFTYGNASRMLGRVGVYLKNTSVVEALGRVNHLVFDKTGTLTQKSGSGAIAYHGESLPDACLDALARLADSSMHPLSKALAGHLTRTPDTLPMEDFSEAEGYGMRAVIGGTTYALGSAEWMRRNGLDTGRFNAASGRTRVYAACGDRVYGYFEFSNAYRPGILDGVRSLAGSYKTGILSGDGPAEADFLRGELGEGADLAFRRNPEEKRAYIAGLRDEPGAVVMMLGDGINDAPALRESDIGVAVTEDTGTFTPNSDIIMHAESLARLPQILRYGRDSRRVLYLCLLVSLFYNVIGLGFAFAGLLTPFVAAVLMPVSSITVVALATAATTYYARRGKLTT